MQPQQPYRQQQPQRPLSQPPRPQQISVLNQQGHQGITFHWIPPGAFFVPRPLPKPKIHSPIWAINNKTTHFYGTSLVAFAQSFNQTRRF